MAALPDPVDVVEPRSYGRSNVGGIAAHPGSHAERGRVTSRLISVAWRQVLAQTPQPQNISESPEPVDVAPEGETDRNHGSLYFVQRLFHIGGRLL